MAKNRTRIHNHVPKPVAVSGIQPKTAVPVKKPPAPQAKTVTFSAGLCATPVVGPLINVWPPTTPGSIGAPHGTVEGISLQLGDRNDDLVAVTTSSLDCAFVGDLALKNGGQGALSAPALKQLPDAIGASNDESSVTSETTADGATSAVSRGEIEIVSVPAALPLVTNSLH